MDDQRQHMPVVRKPEEMSANQGGPRKVERLGSIASQTGLEEGFGFSGGIRAEISDLQTQV
ncbi:MAG: hypothetical protein M5U30_13955 [Burkholderiaceae bacterium]|nr:hypothetical protein [Burkholderiaceae bacterium]